MVGTTSIGNVSRERLPIIAAGTAIAMIVSVAVSQRIFSKSFKHLYYKYLANKRKNDGTDEPDATVGDLFIYPGTSLCFGDIASRLVR